DHVAAGCPGRQDDPEPLAEKVVRHDQGGPDQVVQPVGEVEAITDRVSHGALPSGTRGHGGYCHCDHVRGWLRWQVGSSGRTSNACESLPGASTSRPTTPECSGPAPAGSVAARSMTRRRRRSRSTRPATSTTALAVARAGTYTTSSRRSRGST